MVQIIARKINASVVRVIADPCVPLAILFDLRYGFLRKVCDTLIKKFLSFFDILRTNNKINYRLMEIWRSQKAPERSQRHNK